MTRFALAAALTLLLAAAPAAQALSPVIAAYETYVPGNGFDVRLVDVGSGRQLVVPSGVNTTADEFHPTLSPDGRLLVFTRATLVAQPDGDIVPPGQRVVQLADRDTGAIRDVFCDLPNAAGVGATFVPASSGSPALAFGTRIFTTSGQTPDPNFLVVRGGAVGNGATCPNARTSSSGLGVARQHLRSDADPQPNTVVDLPHAAVAPQLKAVSVVRFDEGSGAPVRVNAIFVRRNPDAFATSTLDALHPTPRTVDGHVVMDRTVSGATDIWTLQVPGSASKLEQVSTADAERMPAWAPNGTEIGFVRTTGTTRNLLVFDAAIGVQQVVNAPLSLGQEAPTAQLRAFQSVWGNLSLGAADSRDSVIVTCGTACSSSISPTGPGATLTPKITKATGTIGILIARITGNTRLLGKRVLKIRPVGRVPLGAARSRSPRFRWNGRVAGRRLARGNYLLTFRALNRQGRVLSTSRSLRFTVTRDGRITRVRPA